MSPQAALLRSTVVIVVTAAALNGIWLLASGGEWPPFGVTFGSCVFVYVYDRFIVRRAFDR